MVVCQDAPPAEMLLGGREKEGFVDDQGGRWSDPKQPVETTPELLRVVLPVGKVVGAGGKSMGFHFSEDGTLDLALASRSPPFAFQQHDAFVAESLGSVSGFGSRIETF